MYKCINLFRRTINVAGDLLLFFLQIFRYGLETGTKLLNFYEKYFDIPFPLEKMDLLAVPSFGPGAMENWGLITFRGERFVVGKEATEEVRQKSFNLIAHELTHQWFGNLATMKFWSDAWLKEGR